MKRSRHIHSRVGLAGAWRSSLRPPAADCHHVTDADAQPLATLLYEAYLGTIDDEGESREQALAELQGFFAGKYGQPLLDACVARSLGGRPIAAALICDWNEHDEIVAGPLVAYVMVHPSARAQGNGIAVMNASLQRLADARWGRVHAVITEGNTPSERLFAGLGFKRIPHA